MPENPTNDTAGTAGSRMAEVVDWQAGKTASGRDRVAEECAVALVYNGISHVVMMATPLDLEDFALGFSLSEGILADAKQLYGIEVQMSELGIEIAMDIATEAFAKLKDRRRNLVGRAGCGLCGAESLAQAIRAPAVVGNRVRVTHAAIQRALAALAEGQPLQAVTGAVHGAAWCHLNGEIVLLREDVGRHNALDKLLGAKQRAGIDNCGFVVITSRASYEMVSKAASAGMEVLAAVSAPTSLAIELAVQSDITLVGFARPGRQVVYHGRERLEE